MVDTNVPVVANGRSSQASADCTLACIEALERIRGEFRLLLDDRRLILEEYRRNLSPSGQPGPGDAFFKWLWDHQAYGSHCRQVAVTPDAARGFAEFPRDAELKDFDRDDRIFVAVALASGGSPPVFNASDPGWWKHRTALERRGVKVEFLCPELMGDD